MHCGRHPRVGRIAGLGLSRRRTETAGRSSQEHPSACLAKRVGVWPPSLLADAARSAACPMTMGERSAECAELQRATMARIRTDGWRRCGVHLYWSGSVAGMWLPVCLF